MVQSILQKCTVDGLIVRLPEGQLDRKTYQDVAKALTLIGGKWKSGKVQGFVFSSDPTELLEQIQGGEKVNLKKEFQFFATPNSLADRLVSIANLEVDDDVLEPSGGQAAIIKAIRRVSDTCRINSFELMPINCRILESLQSELNFNNTEGDFLEHCELTNLRYDKIIANPPFAKNQDIDHVQAMYRLLRQGGRLVSIMSNHWRNSSNKKETAFRDWLEDDVEAEVIEVEAGTFKESGTMIASCIVVIDKKAPLHLQINVGK